MTEQTGHAIEQGGKNGSGFFYFLCGAGLGSLIALLFAPQSGRQTRDSVAQKALDAQDYTRRKVRKIQDRAGALVEQGKDAIREKTEQVSAAIDAGREAYQHEVAKSPNS